mmetsp:Transcript_29314/g.39028  ORF Transcript_29314/g.39028 Transcript_29314/m.39028 type:complete len:89 (+) Transcript_29314:252-518(+)
MASEYNEEQSQGKKLVKSSENPTTLNVLKVTDSMYSVPTTQPKFSGNVCVEDNPSHEVLDIVTVGYDQPKATFKRRSGLSSISPDCEC